MPDHPSMQFNLGRRHNCAPATTKTAGEQYRWHEALPENHDLVRPPYPEWRGERVTGRRFLLVGEQGLGDQLQFLRMTESVASARRAGRRLVEAPLSEVARNAARRACWWTTAPPGP